MNRLGFSLAVTADADESPEMLRLVVTLAIDGAEDLILYGGVPPKIR